VKKFQRVNKDETNQLQNQLWNIFSSIYETQNHQWTLGHPMLNMNPMLFIMSTLWIREHNRVCDELIKQWPEWTDEQVYSASKRIVIGEMMGIMMNDILNAGNSFSMKHDPEIFHGHIKYIKTFNTPYELLLTTILPSGLPEEFNNTNMYSWMLNNNKYGFDSRYGYSTSERLSIVFTVTHKVRFVFTFTAMNVLLNNAYKNIRIHIVKSALILHVRLNDNRRCCDNDRFVSSIASY
jgi:hypothetical protein